MQVGDVFEMSCTVLQSHLASCVGSGDKDVLATPVMVCWMEAASVSLLNLQDEAKCSLGVKVDIEHVAATPIGALVKVTSRLTGIDGKKYTFFVEAFDEHEKIGFGTHVRVVTDAARFMERVNKKTRS